MTTKTFKTLVLAMAAALGLAACSDEQSVQTERIPIRLTTTIASTRAIASPTQETQLVNGQKVYVWAKNSTAAWTADNYLKAWTLTAGDAGALTGTPQYYPEGNLSMVAIHGNFSFTEGTDAYPGTVEHTVAADQNVAGGYECSDLVWWKNDDVAASSSAIAVTLGRNLSKIEITLVTGDYTADELDKATVKLQNVLPTVSMDMADGSISDAYGSPITITPRKTGKINYEAILPPQQKPLDFIRVELGGTVIKVDAKVEEFDANTRYPYDLNIAHKDVRKNPLWYVAEYNVNYDGSSTYTWAATPDEGYYFNWTTALKSFTNIKNAIRATPSSLRIYYSDSGSKFSGWHLPTLGEWASIMPGYRINIWGFDSEGNGTYRVSTLTLKFGYDYYTQTGITESAYWKKISSTELHALRYLGTDYCSAWKYVWNGNSLVVYATLVGNIDNNETDAKTWYDNNWSKVYFGNYYSAGAVMRTFYASGYYSSGNNATGTGETVYYPSASEFDNDNALMLYAYEGYACIGALFAKSLGSRIRLFRTSRPAMPIEYVAQYNMATATTFATNYQPTSGAYFTWANTSATTNGTNSGPKANVLAMRNGTAISGYHLPSVYEWMSVVPPNYTPASNPVVDVDGSGNSRITFKNGQHLNLGETVAWGVKNSSGTYGYAVNRKFYNDYNCPNDAAHTYIGYALRFKEKTGSSYVNGIYTCAFRYEYKTADSEAGNKPSLTIQAKYVGETPSINISTISDETWWSSSDYTVILPSTGYTNHTSPADHAAGYYSTIASNSPAAALNGYYWSATPSNSNIASYMYFGTAAISGDDITYPGRSYQIRLFADR